MPEGDAMVIESLESSVAKISYTFSKVRSCGKNPSVGKLKQKITIVVGVCELQADADTTIFYSICVK